MVFAKIIGLVFGVKFGIEVNISELTLRFNNDSKFVGLSEAINLIWFDKGLCEIKLLCANIIRLIIFEFDIFSWMELILSAVYFEEVEVRIVENSLL